MENFKQEALKKQVVNNVLCFSSQYGASQSYAASNLVGDKYNYPSYGDFTQAFVLRSYGPWWHKVPSARAPVSNTGWKNNFISEDFVDIQFKHYVFPTKIEIFETYNPGAVVRILALLKDKTSNNKQRWVTLWAGKPQQCPPKARKFSPPLKKTNYPTNLIRLEFNQQHLNYYTELDAVCLHGTQVHGDSLERLMSALHLSPKTPKSLPSRQLSLTKEHDVLKENGLFDSLPSELIQYMFSFLELIDLIRAAGTCRLFLQHCYDQVWYKELDLKPYWSLITSEVLDSLHTRCSSTEKLDLSWSGPYEAISSDSIIRFLQHCGSNLVCLRLSCCQYVDNDVIKHLGQYCPNLEELDLQSCNSNSLTREGLLRLQDLKKLQRINLYRVKVRDDVVEQLIHSAKNLRHLNLGGCDVLMECDMLMQSLSIHCRGLVSLDLWRNKGLTGKGVRCLADGCSLLEELDIGWCTNVTSAPECVVYLTSKCKKLRKLFLTALRSVNDDIVNALANNCPDIEQVDVLGTGLIHAESIMRLLRQCKHLKLLDVSFCSQLTVEIVEGLQEMYPAVSIKKSFIVEESAT